MIPKAWRQGTVVMQIVQAPRHRASKRPIWIIVLISMVCVSLIGAYIYPPRRYSACYFFATSVCNPFRQIPSVPTKVYSDDEMQARLVIRDLLHMPSVSTKTPKIAFMFLTPGPLPFEKLWDKFLRGHEDKFTIYIHASKEKAEHESPLFANREIRSDKVDWGKISMVDAERRLLAYALEDPDNQHFVLLSDSCVPLHNFDHVYSYLVEANMSFIDCFKDPGPHGNGRYSTHMAPEIEKDDFRKGAQWFTMKRQHALIVLADNLFYSKFKLFCKPGADGHNCYADEHYLPTFFSMLDPAGIANWSVTHVDWSEAKWHPKMYRAQDVNYQLWRNITSISLSVHVSSDEEKVTTERPCLWNGKKRPCYLFARKFYPETLDVLMEMFSNYTIL